MHLIIYCHILGLKFFYTLSFWKCLFAFYLFVSIQVYDAYVNILSIVVFFSLTFSHMTRLNAERPDMCFRTSATGVWGFVFLYTHLQRVRFQLISHCQGNFSPIHVSVIAFLCARTCCSAISRKARPSNSWTAVNRNISSGDFTMWYDKRPEHQLSSIISMRNSYKYNYIL